jgi:5-methylcytosine-specific restriction endonuclease McrA
MNTSNKYYWDNREARLAYGAKWRKENKDKMETARKRWSDANPDYVKKIYPSKVGKDVLRERAKVQYLKHREKRLAQANARYKDMTPEQRTEHNRKRRERHARQPDVRNKIERIRDHQKRAYGSLTKEVWAEVCRRYADTCIYCGSTEKITIEHLQPISRGGTNEASNLAPACLSCNSSKRNKTYKEYVEWRNKQN